MLDMLPSVVQVLIEEADLQQALTTEHREGADAVFVELDVPRLEHRAGCVGRAMMGEREVMKPCPLSGSNVSSDRPRVLDLHVVLDQEEPLGVGLFEHHLEEAILGVGHAAILWAVDDRSADGSEGLVDPLVSAVMLRI